MVGPDYLSLVHLHPNENTGIETLDKYSTGVPCVTWR